MEHISIETTMDIYAQVTDKKNGIKEEEWVQSGECRSWERCFKHAQGVGSWSVCSKIAMNYGTIHNRKGEVLCLLQI